MTTDRAGALPVDRFPRVRFRGRARHIAAAILAARLWSARRRHRLNLAAVAALGERTMLDLGFDPDDVRAEAAKPFWRP